MWMYGLLDMNYKDLMKFVIDSTAIEGVHFKKEDLMPKVTIKGKVVHLPYTKAGKKKAKKLKKGYDFSNLKK